MRLEPLLVLLAAVLKFFVDTKNAVIIYTNTAYETTLVPYVTTAIDVVDILSHDLLFAVCPIRCFSQQNALAIIPRMSDEEFERRMEEIFAMGLFLVRPVEKVQEPVIISLLVIIGNAAGPVE